MNATFSQVCTSQSSFRIAERQELIFLIDIVVPRMDFNQSQKMFQCVSDKTGFTHSEEIYYSSCWRASNPFLPHRDLWEKPPRQQLDDISVL